MSDFSYWILQQCNNPRFLFKINIIREYASKEQVPQFIYERNDSQEKITMWAGLCGNGTLLGQYIFNENVNGYNYLQIMISFSLNCRNTSIISLMAFSSICGSYIMELQHIA